MFSIAESFTQKTRQDTSYEQNLAIIRRLAWILDSSIPIPLTKFRIGLDAVIGLVPWVGDIIGSLLSFGLLFFAARTGVSRWTLIRMSLNVLVELIIGLVPFLGDVFDAVWKANERNVRLLERSLRHEQAGRRDLGFLLLLSLGFLFCLGIVVYGSFQVAAKLYDLAVQSSSF